MSKGYIVPKEITDLNKVEHKLQLLKDIKRSFSVYRIDCGSCNGCEIEIFASITPMWDPERFGFKLVANPRHADILLCTGPLTRHMYYPLLRAFEAAPDPKIVIAYGACGSTGGIFHDSYSTWGGIDKVIPVDVWIPGCPPHPATTIYGLATGLGVLEQRLKLKENVDGGDESPKIESSLFGNTLFERDLLAKSKVLMAYLHGRILYKKYINAIKESTDIYNPVVSKKAIEDAIEDEPDPRYRECLQTMHNDVYLRHLKTYKNIDTTKENICFTQEEIDEVYS
ncbi:MAG: NADH-quinone oxidoreductase subunit B family protein [Sulfurovum sp.]|nr:NADH-quinone oxidoreductase subunit B family protein [Sulfurovum sp.]